MRWGKVIHPRSDVRDLGAGRAMPWRFVFAKLKPSSVKNAIRLAFATPGRLE